MMNLLTKYLVGPLLAVIIIAVGGVAIAAQIPTAHTVNTGIKSRAPRPSTGVLKSAPIEEEEPPPEVHYFSISPLTLVPKNDSVPYDKVAGSLRNADGSFYAQVHLPQGATITSLVAYVYEQDSTPATFIEIYLYRKPNSDDNSQVLAHTNSQAVEESYAYEMIGASTLVSGTDRIVDNQNYTYFVRATFDTNNPSPGMRLGSIIITYTQ